MLVRVAAALWLAGALGAAEIECPGTVQVRQVATDPPPGWTVSYSAATVRLASVTFFDGKPEEEASLVYDSMTPGRTYTRAVWTFAPGAHIWLACGYSGTSVVLSRELPSVTRCTVLYRRNVTVAGLPQVGRMYCR
jgi:hypothetical protein